MLSSISKKWGGVWTMGPEHALGFFHFLLLPDLSKYLKCHFWLVVHAQNELLHLLEPCLSLEEWLYCVIHNLQ
jgi:hypothetical protein